MPRRKGELGFEYSVRLSGADFADGIELAEGIEIGSSTHHVEFQEMCGPIRKANGHGQSAQRRVEIVPT